MAKPEEKPKTKKRKLKTSSNEHTNPPNSPIPNSSDSKPRKSKKPKLSNLEEKNQPPKSPQIDDPIEIFPIPKPKASWNNLDLILSIRHKDLDIEKKVEIAFEFVESRKRDKNGKETDVSYEMLSFSRLIVDLNDWIQSQLISTGKKIKFVEACLDYRCWEVFRFCLAETLNLNIPLRFTNNLLRAFSAVVRNILGILDRKEMVGLAEGFGLYEILLECARLLFSSLGGLFNAKNMDLSVSLVLPVVELVNKIYSDKIVGDNVGDVLVRFSCAVLDPFGNFLRVHPNPTKNVFQGFVDKLLEPVLSLVVVLESDKCGSLWTGKLLRVVEDILSNGLFHLVHIDGFLSMHGMKKYMEPSERKGKDQKAVNKSYHWLFFQKVEKIAAGNVTALGGIGDLFRLFVIRVKKQKGVSVLSSVTEMVRKAEASGLFEANTGSAGHDNAVTDKSRLDATTWKSVFDLFVQFAEPLIVSLKRWSETNFEMESHLLLAHSTLKSLNKVLSSLMQEKIYARAEDDSEGARLNFLKEVYQTIVTFSAKIHLDCLSPKIDGQGHTLMLPFMAKEIVISLGYFLEIEYEVVTDDLVSLWLIIILYAAVDLCVVDTPETCLLTPEVVRLGCKLLDVYSDLRQVDTPIFALCKAIRLFGFSDMDNELKYSRFLSCKPSLSIETCVKSVASLLCSEEFRLEISSALTSIPEGQASGCIRQLKMDISESMDWMKLGCSRDPTISSEKSKFQSCNMSDLNLQAELLGRALSEIYTLVLDCSVVTIGNCILVGNSLKDLLAVFQPSLSVLVGKQPDSVDEFLFTVTGRSVSYKRSSGSKHNSQTVGLIVPSIFVFFFRLYISVRSLYREAISLMPPGSSRKTSAAIGDLFTANAGRDWMDGIDWKDGGYFSWIVNPSDPLMSIIRSVSDMYLLDSATDCATLTYILHVMALQRLVDLNRQIKAFEFLHERAVRLDGIQLTEDDGLSLHHKDLSVLREEARELTSFLMASLPLVVKKVRSADNYVTSEGTEAQDVNKDDTWDLSVSSVTTTLLPTAVWWILCRNIDVWCIHATKNKLKKFLSCLFHNLASSLSSFEDDAEQNMDTTYQFRKVTLRQISLELLSDTVFHEQSFLRRHLTSRFCHLLEKSILVQFGESLLKDVDLNSLPNWPKVVRKLERKLDVLSNGRVPQHEISVARPHSVPSILSCCRTKLTTCQNLLNLLCWMPKVSTDLRSFSVFSTYILNLERLVVFSLLQRNGMHDRYGLFRLFVHCRKALKCLIMELNEENCEVRQSLIIPVFSESSHFVLWLLKSVVAVIEVFDVFPEEHRYTIFSLMDHTTYVLLTVSKNQCGIAVNTLLEDEVPQTEIPVSAWPSEKKTSNEADTSIGSESQNASQFVIVMAETLKEQTENIFVSLKTKSGNCFSVMDLKKVSALVSCIQGYCWGLVSFLENIEQMFSGTKQPPLQPAWKSKLNLCIAVYEDFINFCLHVLVEEHQQPNNFCDSRCFPVTNCKNDSLSLEDTHRPSEKIELSSTCQEEDFERTKDELASEGNNVHVHASCETNCVDLNTGRKKKKKKSQLEYAEFATNILADIDSFEMQQLKKPLLRSMLSGENPELAFSVRQLFIASSAILRLKMRIFCSELSSSSMVVFVSTSQFLLSEFTDMVENPDPFCFVWLDGVLKYIEVLGSYVSITNPTLSRDVYARLIDLHLRVIGKCISLQGKGATLASHESESSTKTLSAHKRPSTHTLAHGPYSLDDFKTRLRMSFKALIKKPSELHLLTTVQALERALVGVHEGCSMLYEVTKGGADGGKVSSVVAAGIDCFDLLLESSLGRNLLNVVKRHIQSLLSALFNIVLHLQGPLIFNDKLSCNKVDNDPDPGAVILMCIEIVTKISGNHAICRMEPYHVGQSLRVPAALFQNFRSGLVFTPDKDFGSAAGLYHFAVDQQFSVDLFAGCCRLLCTVLRHHRSETAQCIFLLVDSVNVLLHCLETVDADLISRKGYFAWNVQEGIKSASYLRRIYEEIRHQKEVLGPYCSHFLSNYISLYSGYGPFKTGIRREIDEALRPGVYALIDVCSPDDLQQLHTVMGEGPCRSTLTSLKHDYKLNFQYEGKV